MNFGRDKFGGLASSLRSQIKGQDHAIERVASVLRRGELGLAHPRRPKGSFLFVGPTGVGKTELTNIFTSAIFEGTKPIRFDMSEYQTPLSVEKLIGEKAREIGLLGRALREKAQGTLLFDEIEKAHPLVLDLFLQMLEDAIITPASGEPINLNGFYIVFTSNIGAAEAMRMQSAPFTSIERTVLSRVAQTLRPELVGRITEMVVFNRLPFEIQRVVAEQMIAEEIKRLAQLGWEIRLGPTVIEILVREGYHKTWGMRPMRGVVERRLQEAVVQAKLDKFGNQIFLLADGNNIAVRAF